MTAPPIKEKRKSLIRAEDQILYLCARQNFQKNHIENVLVICRREEIRWDQVFTTAYQHGVAPLVSVNLGKFNGKDLDVPREIADKFRFTTVNSIAMAGKRTDQLAKIYAFFENLSIDIMAIKGAAHEILVYDYPWYTTAGDLDLIIKLDPSEFKQTDRWELEDLKQDIPLEYDFIVHHDVTMNGILPIDFHTIWEDAYNVQFKGQKLYVMSQEDMLITSCINSCRKRYFRLKALFDIAEIISKFPEMNWAQFVRKAKDYQCNNIVYAALWATKETLACGIPASVFADLDINYWRAQIIRRMVNRILAYPLMALSSENRVFRRRAGLSLILPYASYRWDQVIRKFSYVWSTR
jgi:hypothetical protein